MGARENWLEILGRKKPDKRMRGEEIILRYFAFQNLGLETYRTPLKNWLNDAAKNDQDATPERLDVLEKSWENMLAVATTLFSPSECFRRPKSKPINKSLFDLIAHTSSSISLEQANQNRTRFRQEYYQLIETEEFEDLISRAVDHKKRTARRFQIWQEQFGWLGI